MSTIRQQKLAKALIENSQAKDPLNKEKLVVSVGYDQTTAESKAKEIIESKGVKSAMADYGFSEENAKRVVNQILNDEKGNHRDRLKAAELTFKVQGTFAPEKVDVTERTKIADDDPKIIAIAEKLKELELPRPRADQPSIGASPELVDVEASNQN